MTSAYFQVASYRKPEFEITVKTDKPEYIQGDTVKATVQASYFSGGALVNAPVNWRLIGYGYVFNWQDAPSGRYYSFEPFDPEQPEYNPYNSGYVGLIQEGAGKTNADGTFTLELPADLGSAVASQNWMLDVTVTSPTNQQVFNSIQFPVHRGAYYIGLSPASYVVRAGEPADVDIVTLKPDGSVYASADLDVIVYEFQWNSVYEQAEDGNYYWTSSAQRTPVYTTTVTTDRNGAGTVTFTPEAGGQYQITATGQDDAGNTIRSATFIWSSSGEFIAWPRQNNDRIELVADKKLYAPGETARILVPNPFSGTINALVTVERSGVLEANMLELAGSGETLEIPVTADHIPNIYVSVVLVKGVDETNPFPATRVGYVKLAVDTAEKELTIDVAPSATTVRPGDTVTYTLTVRDHKGSPVANASTSVAVVDKAVLVLSQYYGSPQRMVDIYYYERPLGVTTGSLVVINKDRISQQLAESGKGGGGGGGDGLEIREEFADTAFWRADFVSDENGVIEFSVKLPENLTTWRLTAKAITPDTRVGEVTNDIVATKELQVRPLLPRFFTAGDRAVIGGMVANFGREAVTGGEFTIDVAGAFLETTTTVQPFTLDAPGDFVTFNYPVAVDARANSVVVTVTAAAGDRSDGVKIEIPVLHYQTPETVGTSGVVPPGGMAEAIYVPANATDDGELSVTLDPSLGAGLLEGLTYLEHYPYECNEQTVSRFLPNLFTVRALRELNIHDQMLENRLAYQLGIGVQRL
ncbi:MAG: hypothetical protein H3C34_20810, partial [Caldilineaceae bacterium]|nr:hypothetical protein [Caldilineaceae bacterium]